MKTLMILLVGAAITNLKAQSSLKLVVPIGHTRAITSMAVAPDDSYILTGGADNLIYMWGVQSGRLLHTYRGHDRPVSTIMISPSGKYFLSLDDGNRGFIRNTFTGELVDSVMLSYYSSEPRASSEVDAFSWIANDNLLYVWTPDKSGALDTTMEFSRSTISSNGKYMLTIANKKTVEGSFNILQDVYLVNLQTRSFKFLRKVQLAEGNQLGFSPDNSLALVGDDGNAVFAHQTNQGQQVAAATQNIWFNNFDISSTGLLKLNCYDGTRVWDPVKKTNRAFTSTDEAIFANNQPEMQSLVDLGAVFNKAGLDSLRKIEPWMANRCMPINGMADLYHLLKSDWGSDNKQRDVLQRKSAYVFFKKGTSKPVLVPALLAVKLNTKNMVATSRGKNVVLLDLETMQEVKVLRGISLHPPNHVSFAPDNKGILYRDQWPRLWNFNQSKLTTLSQDSSALLKMVNTAVGRLLLVGGEGKIEFRNGDNNSQLLYTLQSKDSNPFGRVRDMQISPDEKFFIWSDANGQSFIKKMNWEDLNWYNNYRAITDTLVVRYDAETGSSGPTLIFKRKPTVNHLFLPGRNEFYTGMNMTWRSGEVPYVFKTSLTDILQNNHTYMPYVYKEADTTNFKFRPLQQYSSSADGKRVLFLNLNDKTVRSKNEIFWSDLEKPNTTYNEYERGQGFYRAKERTLHYLQNPVAAALHPQGQWFAAGMEWTGDIQAIPLEDGDDYKPFVGHTDWVSSIAFSSDGKFMASTSLDNTVKIWDVESRQELVTLVTLGRNEWVVNHASGLFDASPGAMNYIYFSTGLETIGLEQIKDRFYEPNLLKKALSGEKLRTVSGLNKIDLHPAIHTRLDTLNAKLIVTVTDQGGGIGKTSVFLNAKEVVEDLRAQAPANPQSKGALTVTIDLSSIKNLVWGDLNFIGVKAFNGSGYIASPMQKIFYQAPARQEHLKAYEPKLFCLVVGVSDYLNDELDLKYSAKDAHDFAQAVTTAGKRLFNNRMNVMLLSSEAKEEQLKPTKANITRALKDLATQAQVEDLVMMYFSGHGTNMSGDEADFLYLTADARGFTFLDPAIRAEATLSSGELTEYMKNMAAKKQVLIFDACASGRMVENMLAKRDVPSSTLRAMERMKDRTGTYILTGCAADAVSYEASQFGQGLLTYSLLSGMKGAALRDNKFVDVLKLFQFAKDEVPKLAEHVGGIQEPKVFSPYGGESFDIGLLEDADKKLIPLTEAKPFVVRTAFQNEIKLRDDIGLSRIVDQSLAEMALVKNTPFIFVDNQEFPGALYVSGRYKIENGNTQLKVVMFKDDKLVGTLDKSIGSSDPLKIQSAIVQFVQETIGKKI